MSDCVSPTLPFPHQHYGEKEQGVPSRVFSDVAGVNIVIEEL